MAEITQPYKSTDSWKRDIILLTCILRLHCQPSIPYEEIANFLLTTWPRDMQRFAELCILYHPEELSNYFGSMGAWMTGYLSQSFETAEENRSELWNLARGWDKDIVRTILGIVGLSSKGYGMVDEHEMNLQINWRKEGDWRAGSELLEYPPKQQSRTSMDSFNV